MKYVIRLSTLLLFLAGGSGLVYLSTANSRLAADVVRLEAELGKMRIKDANRVHIAEIAEPDIPPEVAAHVERVWQFRCYLPAGYDFVRFSGGGRIAEEGLFQSGGSGSSWGAPKKTAVHSLLTVSLQKKEHHVEAFYSLSGSSGTTSWNAFNPDRLNAVVVHKLVSSQQGPRAFDQNTILPLLKIYDPRTGKEEDGKSRMTYDGGLFVLCPQSQVNRFERLRSGARPSDVDTDSVATPVSDE